MGGATVLASASESNPSTAERHSQGWKRRSSGLSNKFSRGQRDHQTVPARTLQGKSSQFDVLIRRSDASGNSAPRTLPMHEVEGRRQVGGLVRGKTEEDFQGMRGGSIRPMWGEV